MNVIEAKSLTKYYGKTRGIENLTLSVGQGEFFGFIGPNGAGKSTFIRTILGLLSADSGEATVLGAPIGRSNTEILGRIGYLPSETAYYSGMKVKDVISLSAALRGVRCEEEAKRLCERLDLDVSRRVSELSLGNRKKVGIVCALQHCPDLYILDEPTSGLDPLMQRELYAILSERRKAGATVFLSSHVLSEVGRYCDRAAVIREGRLLICNSVENLTAATAKRVTVKGVDRIPTLEGLMDVKLEDKTVSFLYRGDTPSLLKALSELSPSDLTVTEPPMDEIFMHYYGEDK